METTSRAYQLARKLHRQTNTFDYNYSQLHQYGASGSKSITYKQPKVYNIFKDNDQLRIRKLEIQKEREYEITGAGAVLKVNQIKNKRKKDAKNTSSLEKNTMITNKTSRQSFSPFAGSIYLTKDEVIGLHSHNTSLGAKSLQETAEYLCPMKRFNMTETQKQNDSTNISPNETITQNVSKNFSATKLKKRLLEYKTDWNKQSNRRKEREQTVGKLKRKKILNLAESQRCQKQNKKVFRMFQSPAYSWALNLRQQEEKQNKQHMYSQIIEFKGLDVLGKSKLKKQTKWVEQKHNKGFFFCKHLNQTQLDSFHKK